jgi:phasin protein
MENAMNHYEQIMDANRVSFEASARLAAKSLQSANRVLQQSLDLARTMASESAEMLKPTQSGGKDTADLFAGLEKSRAFYSRQLERCAALWRESVGVGMETQSELAHIIQDNLANATRAATLAGTALTAGPVEKSEQASPAKRSRAG